MWSLFGKAVIVLVGAIAGAFAGLIIGMAFLESGGAMCGGTDCIDAAVRHSTSAGALLGAWFGAPKALSQGLI